jgi:anti-sigma regulatory factor (Ser/Thr protein kinase)
VGPRVQRRRSFDRTLQSVREVRAFVGGHASDARADADAAALLASELATNAVMHANSPFEVWVAEDSEVFRVEFVNDAPEMIAALREPSEQGGRGLHIVDTLARAWGTEVMDGQKVVWFELPTQPAGAAPGVERL